jgi:glycosyltransferase involved in cell wall biosynthesis
MNILILAYYSYRDPVFQSAVLPYFLNFPQTKFRFVLLTFEHKTYAMNELEIKKTSDFLSNHRIVWKRAHWRSGAWKPVKKMIDLIQATFVAMQIIRKSKIKAIYSEGFPGAILGHYVSVISGCKHMVHSFEPHADYMVEAGVWKNSSWETKVLRWHEMKVAHRATYIFTATKLMIERLIDTGINPKVVWRVPSCVDLHHFSFSAKSRNQIRNKLGVERHTPILVYLGKFGGMYMEEEAFEFFKLCQDVLDAWILIISPEPVEKISAFAEAAQLRKERMTTRFLGRDEIPGYLSAADIGFVAVRQWPSKKYCSPIKTGEYLACGLPVIVPLGVSDDVEALAQRKIGIPMTSFKKSAYLEVINEWRNRIKENNVDEVQRLARYYVEEDRSIDRYKELYAKLFDAL